MKKLFEGLVFFPKDKDSSERLSKHGGKVLEANDYADETVVVLAADSKKKRRSNDDEYGENQWKVFSTWVDHCILNQRLVSLTESDGAFLAQKSPENVTDPVLKKLSQEFTKEDDVALTKYAMDSSKRGNDLSHITVWTFLTKQKSHPLSRFTAQQLMARYQSFGEDNSPSKQLRRRSERNSTTQQSQIEEEEADDNKAKSRSASKPATGKKTNKALAETEIESDTEDEKKTTNSRKSGQNKAAKAPSVKQATTTTTTTTKASPAKKASQGPISKKARFLTEPDEEISEMAESRVSTRGDAKYTREENEALQEFVKEHPSFRSNELWSLAVAEKICPGRTAVSMRNHYRKLSERSNRTQFTGSTRARNFTAEEDHEMFRWLLRWRQEYGTDGIWGRSMWDAAENASLIPDRTGEQMYNRFHNSLSKNMQQGLHLAAQDHTDVEWDIPARKQSAILAKRLASPGSAVIIPSGGPAASTSSTKTIHHVVGIQPHALAKAKFVVEDVKSRVPEASMSEILRALYFTCANEEAAVRLLQGEDPDSTLDIWTSEEDRRLMEGEVLVRPDVHKRRVFLGLDVTPGL